MTLEELPGIANLVELWPVEKLTPYQANPYDHAADDIPKIAQAIRANGFLVPIAVDLETREIIDGHARLEAAILIGLDRVPVTPFDHLDEAQRRVVRISINRHAELRTTNPEKMLEELAAIAAAGRFDLSLTGYDESDLAELERELAQLKGTAGELDLEREIELADAPAAPAAEPEAFEPPSDPVVRLGDVFDIGPHRLLVGDAFDAQALHDLLDGTRVDAIVTDPPFAIFGSSTGVSSDVADDKMIRPFFAQVMRTIQASLKTFGHAFTFTDWRTWSTMHEAGKATDLTLSNVLIWDKGDFGFGSNYGNCHEFVGFWQQLPKRKSIADKAKLGRRLTQHSNILRFARARLSEANGYSDELPRHSAAKPIPLLKRLIENATDVGERVLDPFVGMGSTLLAAAESKRVGIGVEIEPKWAEVTLIRLERTSGLEARLVGSGKTLAQLRRSRRPKA